MTINEAAAIVRQRWADNDGCRSCGWKPALAEVEPLEHWIDASDLANGYVDLLCQSDDESSSHRGVRVYFTDLNSGEHP